MNMSQEHARSKIGTEGRGDLFSSLQQTDGDLGLEQEVVQLSDRFTEFVCINAFLCDSFTSMLAKQEAMSDEVVRGALYCSETLKIRSVDLKNEFDHLREQIWSQA
jgi:hypothetical protein